MVKDWPYAEDFVNALKEVNKKYICYAIDEEHPEKYKYPERIFAYEFYHQYRKIMEGNPSRYEGVYLNGEQYKGNKEHPIAEELSKAAPDLVLHGNLSAVNENTQYWLCEIKMHDNEDALDDLCKLKRISQGRLKFRELIFLYVGVQYESKKDAIINYKSNHDCFGKTICVFYYRDDETYHIVCKRLNEIK